MAKKKFKYIPVKKSISSDQAMNNAIVLLDAASQQAIGTNDVTSLALAGNGWAHLFKAISDIEEGMKEEVEIVDLQGDIEFANPVGFSPTREYEEEEDE